MAQRLIDPFTQILDDASMLRDGSRLFFYASGTSTKLNTYVDAAWTTPNSNPVILNEFGQPSLPIFGLNRAYKIVLCGPDELGTDDPPTNVLRTVDPVSGSDFSSFPVLIVGSGNPTGVVAGTAASAGVLPTQYWDYVNLVLYVCRTTGDAATAVWTAINASAATPSVPAPQGYLTLTSGTPIIPGDVASATTVYYTPKAGALIPIYNGASFTPIEFVELPLALVSSHALNTIYDFFVASISGVPTLVTGPAWSNSAAGTGARGTGGSTTQLTRIKGFDVNAVAMTGRNGATTYSIGANLATYVGSGYIDATAGQITCHRSYGQSRKWGLWNAHNRSDLRLKAGDNTSSWTYTAPTARPSNNNVANSLTVFSGLPEESYDLRSNQSVFISGVSGQSSVLTSGIGFNSTTAFSGRVGKITASIAASFNNGSDCVGSHVAAPSIGINAVTFLEAAPAAGANTNQYNGSESNMVLSATWRG